jgi:hypothetical protein
MQGMIAVNIHYDKYQLKSLLLNPLPGIEVSGFGFH